MFNTLHEGAISVRIGVAALPTTRAISYHENRSVVVGLFLIVVVLMAAPPPQGGNLSPWLGLLITEFD